MTTPLPSVHPIKQHFPGSILASIVAPNSDLGELLAYVRALDCTIAEIKTELAALRAHKWTTPTFEVIPVVDYLAQLHSVYEFISPAAPIDRFDEPMFAVKDRQEKQARKNAWIAAKAARLTPKRKNDEEVTVAPDSASLERERLSIAHENFFDRLRNAKPEPRAVTALELEEMRTAERKEWERRERLGLTTGLAKPDKNFCVELFGMYVQENWKPREGSTSSNFKNLAKAYAEKNVRELNELRTRSKDYRYSIEARYFQFVTEDLANPKTGEEAKAFWSDIEHPINGRRHYVRHSKEQLTFVRQEDMSLATEQL